MNAATTDLGTGMLASEKELRALRSFVSKDATRENRATLWCYASEGGCTYVATDGHTMAIRRSGSHRTAILSDIAKLQPIAIEGNGTTPFAWHTVMRAPNGGKLAEFYGFNL